MEKTSEEMAEHVRAAVRNLNGVLKEVQAEHLKIKLSLTGLDEFTGSVLIESIQLLKSL